MGVSAGLYMYDHNDVVVKSSRSLSHLLMSSCPYSEYSVHASKTFLVIRRRKKHTWVYPASNIQRS